MKKIFTASAFILLISSFNLFAATIAPDTVSGVDRYAIYIGCNYGGKSRERLLYAGSDAKSFKVAMSEIGGVTEENSRILIDPTKESVDKALNEISQAIKNNTSNAKRSEFIFYYSGHSDENSLLIGDTKYDYSKLKSAITEVPSDIHVVILDSCYSGNFIRTKGGQKRKPFLIDDSSVVTGHAYLSSSSDNESSQESDEIESSYFTNAMITGLRGAADTSGDNKVTLNELYSYAFNDTLSKTESSKAGPQHPNYNITLVGSGDLVLSDLTTAEAMLSLSKEAKGKFIIRDANDKLISEINKIEGQPIYMALPKGQYSALIIDEYSTKQGTFLLEKDQVYVLDQNSLTSIKRKTNRLRGDNAEKADEYDLDDENFLSISDLEDTKQSKTSKELDDDDIFNFSMSEEFTDRTGILIDENSESNFPEFTPHKERSLAVTDIDNPFTFTFVPGVNFVGGDQENSILTLGILGSKVKNNIGLQSSGLFNIATGDVIGAQVSGIFNIATESSTGAQVSGLFNISDDAIGSQVTGLYNIASYMNGAQVSGFMNITKEIKGPQITGFANISKITDGIQFSGFLNVSNSIQGIQLSGFLNTANNMDGIQIGVINIARESTGATLGIINYVGNGLHDFCISMNSNDSIEMFYQGGAKGLFTTIGYSKQRETFFDQAGFGATYFGVGTEFSFPLTSIDFEFLWKIIYNDKIGQNLSEQDIKFNKMNIDEKFAAVSMPSFKISWNLFESQFFRLFVACDFDIHVKQWNDYAFEMYNHSWMIDSDNDFQLGPTFNFGCKFKL